MTNDIRYTLTEAHKQFAIEANGSVWSLIDQSSRTPQENDELLYAAFASCYHWTATGSKVHQQRGEYLIAKTYLSLGNAVETLAHARRCIQLTEEHGAALKDFDRAYAFECLARALAMNGELAQAQSAYAQAQAAAAAIANEEDRGMFEMDFMGGEWFGLQ